MAEDVAATVLEAGGVIVTQVIYAVAAIPFVVLFMLYYAWPASILWGWFIAPLFSVPSLSPWQAVAVMLTLSLFRPRPWSKQPEGDFRMFCYAAAIPPMSLVVGAIIKFGIL